MHAFGTSYCLPFADAPNLIAHLLETVTSVFHLYRLKKSVRRVIFFFKPFIFVTYL